jgi:hypothetical protein
MSRSGRELPEWNESSYVRAAMTPTPEGLMVVGYKTSVLKIDKLLEQQKQNEHVKLMRLMLMKFLIPIPLSSQAIIQDPNPSGAHTMGLIEPQYSPSIIFVDHKVMGLDGQYRLSRSKQA